MAGWALLQKAVQQAHPDRRYEITYCDLDEPHKRKHYSFASSLAGVRFAVAAIEQATRWTCPYVNDRLPHLAPKEADDET